MRTKRQSQSSVNVIERYLIMIELATAVTVTNILLAFTLPPSSCPEGRRVNPPLLLQRGRGRDIPPACKLYVQIVIVYHSLKVVLHVGR